MAMVSSPHTGVTLRVERNATPVRDGDFVPSRASGGGFTLVELLIAMTLVGLITLLLFSGLRLGTRAWEGVEAAADRTGALRVARNFLDRTLNQARVVSLTFDGEIISVFSGEAQALEFVAPLSEHVGIPGLYVVRLTLDEGSSNRRVSSTRISPPAPSAAPCCWTMSRTSSCAISGAPKASRSPIGSRIGWSGRIRLWR